VKVLEKKSLVESREFWTAVADIAERSVVAIELQPKIKVAQ
jgi:hypothetical protein